LVIYDQARIVGSDFKLAHKAKGLVVLVKDITVSALMQAIMRKCKILISVSFDAPNTSAPWAAPNVNQSIVFGIPEILPEVNTLVTSGAVWVYCQQTSEKLVFSRNIMHLKQRGVMQLMQIIRQEFWDRNYGKFFL
jgi:hypothetical protein